MSSYQHYKSIKHKNGESHLFRVDFQRETIEWVCVMKNRNPFIFYHNSIQLLIRLGTEYQLEEITSEEYHEELAKVLSKKCTVKTLNIDGLRRNTRS